MNRILFETDEVPDNGTVIVTGDRAQHMLRVLRVAPGDTLRVGILDGPTGTARVEQTTDHAVELTATWGETPPRPVIDLLLAVPRPKVMRRLWAPLASMGVGQIILTNAAKVERNYFDTHWLAAETYRPRLVEGLSQAGDTRVPTVTIERRFKPLIEDRLPSLCPNSMRLMAHPRCPERLGDMTPDAGQRVLLAIGPEGGWTPFELELLASHGFHPFSMGSRILRTDTACMALLALAADWMAE